MDGLEGSLGEEGEVVGGEAVDEVVFAAMEEADLLFAIVRDVEPDAGCVGKCGAGVVVTQ